MRWLQRLRSMPSPCFISHAYRDGLAEAAARALPKGVLPIIFPAIHVSPTQFVSDSLVAALDRANSVMVVDGPAGRTSFWVAFEAHYAAHNSKPVYRFDSTTSSIKAEESYRRDPPVFASYAREDSDVVREICLWLENKRGFKVWADFKDLRADEQWQVAMENGLKGTLEDGGFVIAFMSSARSVWIEREIRHALKQFPDQIYLACLGPEKVVVPADLKMDLIDLSKEEWLIELVGEPWKKAFADINHNRLDDLMVRVLYRVFQRQGRLSQPI